jgi:hypothetical protein
MVDVRYATGPIATELVIPMAQVLTTGGSLANDEAVSTSHTPSKSSHWPASIADYRSKLVVLAISR